MNWNKTQSNFTYCEDKVTRHKATCSTILGQFEVFESVNGKCWVRHPLVSNPYIGAFGFNNGCEEWFGKPRKQVKSLEEGFAECESVLIKLKQIVNDY